MPYLHRPIRPDPTRQNCFVASSRRRRCKLYSRRFKTVANRLKSEHVHGNCPISITKSDATRRDVTKQFCRVGSGHQSSNIRIMRIIFLESYARILTYETLSYVNHIVAKQARRNVFVSAGGYKFVRTFFSPSFPSPFPSLTQFPCPPCLIPFSHNPTGSPGIFQQ